MFPNLTTLSLLRGRWEGMRPFDNFYELFVGRTFFRHTSLQVHRIKGMQVLVDHRAADAGSIRLCLYSDMYKRFFPLMALPGEVNLLDLGSNVGGFPVLLRASGVGIRKPVCVELNPNTFTRLRFNIDYNFRDAEVINAAVLPRPGSVNVSLGWGSTDDNIDRGSVLEEGKKRYEIAGVTLDQLYLAHFPGEVVDILKMDIEGVEHEILGNPDAESSALAHCRYLIVEIHHVALFDPTFEGITVRHDFELLGGDPVERKTGVFLFGNRKLTDRTR